MIDRFKSGHWYIFINKMSPSYFNMEGEMDFVLDGKPHRCKEGDEHLASFYDSPDPDCTWSWHLEDFIEINPVIEMLKEVYDKVNT